MVLIGMLHHRKDPKKFQKSYAYAIVAQAEGAEFLYFSPRAVDFGKKIINGFQYKDGEWRKVKSRFPDVIYNTGSPEKLNNSIEIVNELKKYIPFTTFSVGNKLSVYKRLKTDGELSNYLIPSYTIYSVAQFKSYFKLYPKLVFKPVNGHKGQGVTFIEQIGNEFHLQSVEQDILLKENELLDHIFKKINEVEYLVQPYINSKTKNGDSFDFRLHIQKNGQGQWIITTIYPRIAPSGSIITNINSGGQTLYLDPFLKQEFGDDHNKIKNNLENFCFKIAKKMDEIQLRYFNETIDELGVDIGLDDMNKIWIYEVNWRPGCPPAFYLELDVVKNMIHYAMFLARDTMKNKKLKIE